MGRKKTLIKIDNSSKKKLVVSLVISFILLSLLIVRIGFIQFVQGASLKEDATKNQLASKTITPNRGTIYDSTGKVLAISADVDTVSVNPSNVKYKDGTDVNKEVLAHALSKIFGVDYDELLENLNKTSKKILPFRSI